MITFSMHERCGPRHKAGTVRPPKAFISGLMLASAFVFAGSAAAQSPLVLDPPGDWWNLAPHLEYLRETQGPWTYDAVRQPPRSREFTPLDRESVNFGLTDAAYWFRFTVTNPGPQARIYYIELDNARLSSAECILPEADGKFQVQRAGATLPFSEHTLHYTRPTFRLSLEPHQEQAVFLRVANRGWYMFGVALWDQEAFRVHRTRSNLAMGLLYGALLAMAVQSTLVLLRLRDGSLLFHFLFILSWLMFEMTFHGTAHQFLWPESTWWADRAVLFFLGLATAFTFALSRSFLNTRRYTPRWDKVLLLLILVALAVAPLKLICSWLWVNYIAHVLGAAGPIIIFVIALQCWRRGSRPAPMFLSAWGAMIAGVILIDLVGVGLAPRTFLTLNALHIGLGIAPLLFALALAERVRSIQEESRAHLEEQVAARTRELREALDNVKTLSGLIPICSNCRKVRNDKGYWDTIERYVREHAGVDFTHGICPECLQNLYGDEVSRRINGFQD